MIYESRATVLMFEGDKLRVVNREDFLQEIVLDSKVDYHLIDQKRVTEYESGSEEAKEIMQRVNAAEMAFEWFGGIPWFLWDVEANGLTVEAFEAPEYGNQGAHLHALKHAPGGAQVETCVRAIQQTMVLRRIS
ncbi:hypothetical protein SELMODRAFT_403443 [Selaginella moellendorffii]|uniref:Uncharacterized protein n=1 Tax=Selaginella moellendorffii TaxID=88036 RepID=D8QRF3_SELML|nr:hypothetical protein SELMODRAFT_403443 [Selaginella moellendorffii]